MIRAGLRGVKEWASEQFLSQCVPKNTKRHVELYSSMPLRYLVVLSTLFSREVRDGHDYCRQANGLRLCQSQPLQCRDYWSAIRTGWCYDIFKDHTRDHLRAVWASPRFSYSPHSHPPFWLRPMPENEKTHAFKETDAIFQHLFLKPRVPSNSGEGQRVLRQPFAGTQALFIYQ